MLPGTIEATSHFLCPAPGALGDWVLLGERGQDQLQESLPPALCSEAAVPRQPYCPKHGSLGKRFWCQMPAQPWVRWCQGEPRASSMAGALCFANPVRQ